MRWRVVFWWEMASQQREIRCIFENKPNLCSFEIILFFGFSMKFHTYTAIYNKIECADTSYESRQNAKNDHLQWEIGQDMGLSIAISHQRSGFRSAQFTQMPNFTRAIAGVKYECQRLGPLIRSAP